MFVIKPFIALFVIFGPIFMYGAHMYGAQGASIHDRRQTAPTSYSVAQKALVLTKGINLVSMKHFYVTKPSHSTAADLSLASKTLQSYGIPFDVISVPSTGIATGAMKLVDTNNNALYSMIVMTSPIIYQYPNGSWLSAITQENLNIIYNYQATYNVRLVVLQDSPNVNTGITAIDSGTGIDQQIVFSTGATATSFATVAGLQASLSTSASGLWHFPGKITNSSIATSVLSFLPAGTYRTETVAAALIKMNGRQQLSFYFEAGTWSSTTMLFGHMWVGWGSKGFYSGYRRVAFSSHVDDLFLYTPTNESLPDFRLSNKDMIGVYLWRLSSSLALAPSTCLTPLGKDMIGVYL